MNLIQIYPNWMNNNGIFTDLATYIPNLPWGNDINLAGRIDLEYFGNISGHKEISPLLEGLSNNSPLSVQYREKVAKMIWDLFNKEWIKLYNVYTVEYNPISNYDMTETEKINHDMTDTSEVNTTGKVETDSVTDNSIFGFNSSSESAADKQVDDVTTNTTNKNVGDRSVSDDTDRELKRSGNIGVTTSQQMIQSEIDLWQWNFFQSIFNNIDDILVCNFWHD